MYMSNFNECILYIYHIYIYIIYTPESSKCLKFETLHHQKQTGKLKFDTQTKGI